MGTTYNSTKPLIYHVNVHPVRCGNCADSGAPWRLFVLMAGAATMAGPGKLINATAVVTGAGPSRISERWRGLREAGLVITDRQRRTGPDSVNVVDAAMLLVAGMDADAPAKVLIDRLATFADMPPRFPT